MRSKLHTAATVSTLPIIALLCAAVPACATPGGADTADEAESGEPDPCVAQDAQSASAPCEGSSDLFAWDGNRCVELCDLECIGNDCDQLAQSDNECFVAHAECIDTAQCELGPVGTTEVTGEGDEGTINASAGVFDGARIYLGSNPTSLGTYLFTRYAALEDYYPSVISVSTPDEWTVGDHPVTVNQVGSYETGEGTLTIESVVLDGDPSQWRIRGQLDVDDSPYVVSGPFEVAGCALP